MQAAGNEITIATTDVMNSDLVDNLRTILDSMAVPPPPVIFEGDKMASDSPLRVLLVSSEQYTSFLQSNSGQFRTLQANAMARSQMAGNNPLFMGDAGLWNGILIIKMPKPIRFYAGDTVKYCASKSSESESSVIVPSSFGSNFAVDRSIILGGQSIAEAMASSNKSGIPFFWSEKELDHGDKMELLIGAIRGVSKIRFDVDTGEGNEITDYGVTVVDTAVPIIGARM